MILFGCLCSPTDGPTAASFENRKYRVLVLHSYHHGFTWSDKISAGIRSTLEASAIDAELIFEFLDARRIHSEAYFLKIAELFKIKYGRRLIDVIICVDDHALNFVVQYGVFADIPSVFCSASGYTPKMRHGRSLTGLEESLAIKETLELALKLHPNTRKVAVITDMTQTGQALKRKAVSVFKDYEKRLEFIYFEDMLIEDLHKAVRQLPQNAIIFLFIFNRDKKGRVFSHEHNLENLENQCSAPIYGVWDFYLGHGIVGGKLTSAQAEGQMAARMALQILQGAKASEIPIRKSPTRYMFDHEQLNRFQINERRLPKNSLVINKPFSFYETYKAPVWGVISVILVLIAIITILLHNILLRRKAEKALRLSEQKFSTAFAAGPDSILITRIVDGVVIDANEQFLNRTGYQKDELIGKSTQELEAWADADEQKRFLAMLLQQGQVDNMEMHFRHKHGEIVPYLISARLIDISNQKSIISISRDIRPIRKAEETLRQYERIVATSSDLMSFVDRNYIYQAVNTAYLKAHSKRREEILGHSVAELMGEELFREKLKPRMDQCLAGQEVRYEHWFDFSGWGKRFMHVTYSPYFDPDHTVTGVVVNSRDMTTTKKLEYKLFEVQKLEALGTLAGGIAHDFNNILMGILGRVSLMLMELDESHPHYDHLKGIDEYVRSASNLTKQLLGFARGGKYEVKPVNINEIVEQSLQMFGRTKKEIQINKSYEEQLWIVEVDRRQIEQVLLNLYVNAWQAMPGGGQLYLETRNVVIDEDYAVAHQAKVGRFVKISVTDTGVGMDAETLSRAFDPFFSTKEMGRGTGLGLASAYGIIENHNGMINAYSEKGSGTTINIYLPVSDKQIIEEVADRTQPSAGTGTILLVDDEPLIIDVGKPLLEKLGYTVYTAKNGQEALRIYREKKETIDLVILDMIMPHLSGGETFDRLKEIDPHIKVVLSSGYSLSGEAEEIMSRGCLGFIQKPFNINDLSKKIQTVLHE